MVKEYIKPGSLDEALGIIQQRPGATLLAGGTFILAGYLRGAGTSGPARTSPETVVDIGPLLPRSISREAGTLSIGAGASFQQLTEAKACPDQLKAAALGMVNRNTRNRATVGGNLGANKSCASLIPFFLAMEATVSIQRQEEKRTEMPLSDWLASPKGIVLSVSFPLLTGRLASALRSSRTACDVATSTAAVAYRLEGKTVRDLCIAMGGFGPHARRWPELESLLEGKSLPPKAEIEKMATAHLAALGDLRGSATYKLHRGAVLLADALHAAEVMA